MKVFTLTAVVATIVAIPILLSNRRAKVRDEQAQSGVQAYEDSRRYDVFDFMGS